jgi:3-methylcrotonyl-CoA carboxylase alpha subunit
MRSRRASAPRTPTTASCRKDGEREVVVIAQRLRNGGLRLELPEGPSEARVQRLEDGRLSIGLGADMFTATVVRRTALDGGIDYTLFMDGESRRLRLVDPLDVTQYEATASADSMVRAPLPGKIIDLRVKAGDTVSKGQALLVLEAMKMEHTLAAPADGTVKSLRYAVGEQVPEGAELVEFE